MHFKEEQSKNLNGINKKLKVHTITSLDFMSNYNQWDSIGTIYVLETEEAIF